MKVGKIVGLSIAILFIIVMAGSLVFFIAIGVDHVFSNIACAERGAKLEIAGSTWFDEPVICKIYEDGEMRYFEIEEVGE